MAFRETQVRPSQAVLGTGRRAFRDPNTRLEKLEGFVNQLRDYPVDILYIIGGDGSMKAAHALWSIADSGWAPWPSITPWPDTPIS